MSIEITSNYDKVYCDKVAEHLAKNYDKGVWDAPNLSGVGLSSEDYKNLERLYNLTVFDAKKKYQKILNTRVLKYFRLKRTEKGEERIQFSELKEILHYKMVTRPKKALREFLYA